MASKEPQKSGEEGAAEEKGLVFSMGGVAIVLNAKANLAEVKAKATDAQLDLDRQILDLQVKQIKDNAGLAAAAAA